MQSRSKDPENVSDDVADTTCIAEYKLNKGPVSVLENNKQMLRGASILLYSSPDRRFVLGLSIERRSTRLWRFDRGVILVSEAFDCDKKPGPLIRYLLHASFASPIQLGFDPTVTRAEQAETEKWPDYIYWVGDECFRTVSNPLSESRARLVISSAVRVWVVKKCNEKGEIEPNAEENVLKDYWVYDDARSERAIQTDILERLADLDKADQDKGMPGTRCETMQELLLTIIADEAVIIAGRQSATASKPASALQVSFMESDDPQSEDEIETSAPAAHAKSPAVSLSSQAKSGSLRQETRSLPSSGTMQAPGPLKPLLHSVKFQRRTVVKEKCLPMYDLSELVPALSVALDTCNALNLLRQAGYLHRDISGGNVMAWDSRRGNGSPLWRGKLADLETCKPYDKVSLHDPVSATLEFMAVEAAMGKFLFLPVGTPVKLKAPRVPRHNPNAVLPRPDQLSTNVPNSQRRPAKPRAGNASRPAPTEPVWHWNPYHDLEALYWLVVWWIMTYYPCPDDDDDCVEDDAVARYHSEWESTYASMFRSGFEPLKRVEVLREYDPKNPQPSLVYKVLERSGWNMEILEILRETIDFGPELLVPAHRAAQATSLSGDTDRKFDISAFQGKPYTLFHDILEDAIKPLLDIPNHTYMFQRLSPYYRPAAKSAKGKRGHGSVAQGEADDDTPASKKSKP